MHPAKTVFLVLIGFLSADAHIKAATNGVASYFTIVADSASPEFKTFTGNPTMNDSGTIAFWAELDSGEVGIFKAERNGSILLVANHGTYAPSINNRGEVVSQRQTGNVTELYKIDGNGSFLTVASTASRFTAFGVAPQLTDGGMAVFEALCATPPGSRGIFAAASLNAAVQVIAENEEFRSFGVLPSMNTRGTVAFAGTVYRYITGPIYWQVNGLYLGNTTGNSVTQRVVTSESAPLDNFNDAPFINDNGQIAFTANESATGGRAAFLINEDGTNLRKIADISGPYSHIGTHEINNLGTCLFFASLDTGGYGLFTGPDHNADRIVATGDWLFGSTVTRLNYFRGLNDNNEIAFFYGLADGRSGVARAKVTVPTTPTSVVSRATHGTAGSFDLPLPFADPGGVESRSGGTKRTYQVVFTFAAPVTLSGAEVSRAAEATGHVNGTPVISADGTTVYVNLSSISDAQTLTVRLLSVNGAAHVAIPFRVLLGDTNGDGVVNSGDILQTRNRSGQVIAPANFRSDVNRDGTLNSGDGLLVRSRSGTSLP